MKRSNSHLVRFVLGFILLIGLPGFVLAEPVDSWTPGTPVAKMRVRFQSVEICWAYAFTELVENFARLKGKSVDLSAEYLAFNAFAPVLAMGFMEQSSLVQAPTGGTIEEAMRKIRFASEILSAKNISERVGLIPESFIGSKPLEDYVDLQRIPSYEKFDEWKRNQILNPMPLNDDDSNYFQLYSRKVYKELYGLFGLRSVGNGTTFRYSSKLYTPKTFAKDYLGFDPTTMVNIRYRPEESDAKFNSFIQSIVEKLEHGQASTLNFNVMGKSDFDLKSRMARPDFVFDQELVAGALADENHLTMGHAVLVVNYMKDQSGKVKALIIQDSFGLRGRDQYGRVTSQVKDRGYDVLTLEYLENMSWEGRDSIDSWSIPLK